MAPTSRDFEQPLLFGGRERRLAHDDRADDRLPGRVAARRAFIELALEDFLVIDLLEQDRRLIFGAPDRGRAAAGAARFAVERQHGEQRADDGIGRRRRERQLQDVAVVQQLGALDRGKVGRIERQSVE